MTDKSALHVISVEVTISISKGQRRFSLGRGMVGLTDSHKMLLGQSFEEDFHDIEQGGGPVLTFVLM